MEADERLAVDRLDVGAKIESSFARWTESNSEVRHVYGAAVAILRLDGRGGHDRGPIPATRFRDASGQSRASLASMFPRLILRGVWAAVEDEPQRDLSSNSICSFLFGANEAAGLIWGEADLERGSGSR